MEGNENTKHRLSGVNLIDVENEQILQDITYRKLSQITANEENDHGYFNVPPITLEEIVKTVKLMKNEKECGPGNLNTELKAAPMILYPILAGIHNKCSRE